MDAAAFILEHATPTTVPIVPEVQLYLAADVIALWEAMELAVGQTQLPPPYWAACWPGGQALARHVLDHPELVRGKRVLDFAAGSGVGSIAAARAGAASVLAADIDPFAIAALALNAARNEVRFDTTSADIVGQDDGWDIIFAGDICYERPAAERFTAWFKRLAARGAPVLMGDPGRVYLPREGLVSLTSYVVPTTKALEDRDERLTTVWRFA